MIFAIVATCVVGYLLGSFNFAIICSRLFRGEDVRQKGSGNAGMTNYARNYGAGKSFLLVIAGDMGKCILAVLLAQYLFSDAVVGGYNIAILMKFAAGLFVLFGHIFPLYFGFKGGKGVLTVGAMLVAFDWRVFLIALAVFLVIVLVTRFMSLGSIIGVLTTIPLIAYFYWTEPLMWVYVAVQSLIWIIVVVFHRENIKRLLQGKETKFAFGSRKRG